MQKLLSFDECSKVESQTQLHAAGDLRNFRQALSLKNDTQRVVAKKINGWLTTHTLYVRCSLFDPIELDISVAYIHSK